MIKESARTIKRGDLKPSVKGGMENVDGEGGVVQGGFPWRGRNKGALRPLLLFDLLAQLCRGH